MRVAELFGVLGMFVALCAASLSIPALHRPSVGMALQEAWADGQEGAGEGQEEAARRAVGS